MARAKMLSTDQLVGVLTKVEELSLHPLRDCAAVCLSFYGGLRACEMAGLSWKDVLSAVGIIGDTIEIPPGIAKKGSGGSVPMHDETKKRLQALWDATPAEHRKPGMPILRGAVKARMSANYLQKRMSAIYQECGLIGVTSHSGRRTFATTLARVANEHGCSLYDVQDLMRHSDVSTTEAYVERSANVGKLVRAL